MNATNALDYLGRIAGGGAAILGLALWMGQFRELLNVHMALGVALVITLWTLAIWLLRRGRAVGLAFGGLAWGAATIGLGLAQTRLLVGDLHWIVEVAHLALGLGAIALTILLARVFRASRPEPA